MRSAVFPKVAVRRLEMRSSAIDGGREETIDRRAPFVGPTMTLRTIACGALMLLVACAPAVTGSRTSLPPAGAASGEGHEPLQWSSWEAETFEEAARQGRCLLVSVQASWCHWCHVMNHETFGNPEVQRLLAARYVAIAVDSDARPDLAERFRNYAWPATVLLTPDAEVVVALRGYRSPEQLLPLLREVAAGRRPPAEVDAPALPVALEEIESEAHRLAESLYDDGAHGWGQRQKYPYAAPLEMALRWATSTPGDAAERWRRRSLGTLAGHHQLIDPVFGGVYQYSLRGRWDRPHFEKIAAVQAGALETFALATRLGVGDWREDSQSILAFLRRFFRDEGTGAFFTSQDADLNATTTGTDYYSWDEERRLAAGVPRLDRARYTGLNARFVVALVELHRSGPDASVLGDALAAGRYIEAQRRPDGLLARGDNASPLAYLDDNAWALRAELALYEATGDAQWREHAERTAAALSSLRSDSGAFYAHSEDPDARGALARRRTPLRENAVVARGLLRLSRHLHDEALHAQAQQALEGVADVAQLRDAGRRGGHYWLALAELRQPYLRFAVVGEPSPERQALHQTALSLPIAGALVSLQTPAQSDYPDPGTAAVFLCNDEACSIPVTEPSALEAAASAFLRP